MDALRLALAPDEYHLVPVATRSRSRSWGELWCDDGLSLIPGVAAAHEYGLTIFVVFKSVRGRDQFRRWAKKRGFMAKRSRSPKIEIDRSAPVYAYDPAVGF